MKYFIAENGQQVGPLEEHQLLDHGLTVNSLVWHEGMEQWARAATLPELHRLLGILPDDTPVPPPISAQAEPQPIVKGELVSVNPPYVQQSPTPVYVTTKSNGIGLAGFILTLAAYFLFWIPGVNVALGLSGLLLSFIGLFREPRGFAIAGFVMSLIGLWGTYKLISSLGFLWNMAMPSFL